MPAEEEAQNQTQPAAEQDSPALKNGLAALGAAEEVAATSFTTALRGSAR
jgi:hypothetical protein